jgi:hypothetical protein
MINLKDSNNQPTAVPKMQDQYLSFSDAVKYLGYGTHNRISKMVRDGHLQAYQVPTVSKLRVLKSEVCSLAVPQLSSKQS